MGNAPEIKLYAVMIDCRDHRALAAFYAKMLCWNVAYEDDEYACLGAPGAMQAEYPGISFQKNEDYVPPVWPETPGAQQQMSHLDFAVRDVDAAVQHALSCGAREAKEQFSKEFRVMLDPEGHPFCLCDMSPLMDNGHFALR